VQRLELREVVADGEEVHLLAAGVLGAAHYVASVP